MEDDKESAPPMPQVEAPFNGIPLDIPTASLDGLAPQTLQFNKRGSLIKRTEKQQESASLSPSTDQNDTGVAVRRRNNQRVKRSGSLRSNQYSIPNRAISADEDMLSRRVRLMYEKGEENVSDAEIAKAFAMENGTLWEESGATETGNRGTGPSIDTTDTKSISSIGPDNFKADKDANELSGGIEYWKNVEAADVDRYGFIRHPAQNPSDGTEPNPLQRVTTSLLVASESPRRKRSIRPPSALGSNMSLKGRPPTRKSSEQSIRPTSSQSAYGTPLRRPTSRLRSATNHLPHNRDRKLKDEAADMLTHPNVAENADADTPAARALRRKEWEREEKWTKMAKPTQRSLDGGGMKFEFDTHSSKLIERTWKGIPDRWRSSAWYSFLDASAKRHQDSPTEQELLEAFDELQYMSSPDDVQIDIDVPRTITSHIMFRRRYRGGQRLLFRVLHAMSLYFPDTGYTQGMASLAATLLAYYDEEHAFIMLVRLWQLRGMEKLYRSGFAGLMDALGDFEREWLSAGEVAKKLVSSSAKPWKSRHPPNNHRTNSESHPQLTVHAGT